MTDSIKGEKPIYQLPDELILRPVTTWSWENIDGSLYVEMQSEGNYVARQRGKRGVPAKRFDGVRSAGHAAVLIGGFIEGKMDE